MSGDYCETHACGRLTMEPQLRKTKSGVAVCDVSVACNRYDRDRKQYTTYLRVTLWNRQAEWAAKELTVGDMVRVNGNLINDDYVQKDGKKTTGRMKLDRASIDLVLKAKKKEKIKSDNTQDEPVVAPEI